MQAKKVIFEGEPAAVSAIGTVELAENITQEDLLRQHKKLLESAKIEITISGGGNTAAAEKLIRDEMAALVRVSPVEKIDYRHNSPAKAEPVYRELKMQVSQSKMVMAFKSDYEDIYTAKLFYVTALNATINKKSALSVGICRGTIITKTHLFSYVCKKL